jgi:hypothetical protein
MLDARLGYSLWALRLAVGVDSVVIGLQRFSSEATPAAVVELVAGLLIFTPFTELAAYFLTVWPLLLALKAVTLGGAYDNAIYDVMLAAGAFALARLTRVNEAAVTAGAREGPDGDEVAAVPRPLTVAGARPESRRVFPGRMGGARPPGRRGLASLRPEQCVQGGTWPAQVEAEGGRDEAHFGEKER